MGQQWHATGYWALNTTVLGTLGHAGINPFQGGPHYHHLAKEQTTGREHSPTH